jgi:hypothetical protein
MSATNLSILANIVDATVKYVTTPSDYIALDTINDYFIWTQGSAVVTDLMTHEPTASELNAAGVIISSVAPVTVPYCLLMDYSHLGGYYTRKVIKNDIPNTDNLRYVFAFSFDGETATEPQLEAWDDSTHTTIAKNILGASTPANSLVKAKCTTYASPGASWVGTAIAGASNVVLLNGGFGALGTLGSGLTSQELYANIKLVIPMSYATPFAETFVLTCRYTYY